MGQHPTGNLRPHPKSWCLSSKSASEKAPCRATAYHGSLSQCGPKMAGLSIHEHPQPRREQTPRAGRLVSSHKADSRTNSVADRENDARFDKLIGYVQCRQLQAQSWNRNPVGSSWFPSASPSNEMLMLALPGCADLKTSPVAPIRFFWVLERVQSSLHLIGGGT